MPCFAQHLNLPQRRQAKAQHDSAAANPDTVVNVSAGHTFPKPLTFFTHFCVHTPYLIHSLLSLLAVILAQSGLNANWTLQHNYKWCD